MVRIDEFAVERWMDDYEQSAKYNLAETCCASISLDDLIKLSGSSVTLTDIISPSRKLIYGDIPGSEGLRSRIGDLYASGSCEPLSPQDVLVANGAIQANFLALYTCVGPGDHVICHYPTYQQLYTVPTSLGAEVSLWKAKEESDWRMDLDELRGMIKANTKLIIINNPQNPTGAVQSRAVLQGVVDIAQEHDITILSDEVYRPLFHSLDADEQENPPSILSLGYEKTIATGSMSKAFSLAGIRLGWIATRSSEIMRACYSCRDYTTISVSQLDDQVATFALTKPTLTALLQRNVELARKNLQVLRAFLEEYSWAFRWVAPKAGTTLLVKMLDRQGKVIDDVEFCKRLQGETGVMFVPASRCFGGGVDFRGYIRIGYVSEHEVLVDGLQALERFMLDGYGKLPLVSA
ncbi:pyridoxal phosphate-dependent transferase [Truncatella angustata]|uniref:Pyridoxal phosphate-dependent transferase n=1 Tax=Truncatella angustata TaxID=152316 RepID=A0A9P8RE74_9PEZI|nr:pyridoxal phosphate-dependent transferase [Truncatella angustata]KAH6638636.1 pyridoxal phosphate-dependent transferase [Truncatella angustata]